MKSLPGNACRGSRRVPLWLRALCVFVCANSAFAQVPPEKDPPVIDKRLEPVKVPDSEKPKRTAEMVARGRQALKEALEKLEEARNSNEVNRVNQLNCVNEKLTQIKGLLRVIEGSDVALQEALVTKNGTEIDYEFTKASVADERVRGLRSQAEQCIGLLAAQAGVDQSVEVTEPDNLAGDDVTNPAEPPPVLVRPPPASPM
jgi:hypothetical protein